MCRQADNKKFPASSVDYNKELLEQVGVTEFPTTWEDFWAMCDKLKEAGIPALSLHTTETAWCPMLMATASMAQTEAGLDFMDQQFLDNFDTPEFSILNSLLKFIGLESWTRNWLMDSDTAFLSVTNIWLWYAAVVTLFVCAELSSISTEISEAAKIDGASSWKVDWYIHLALLKRAIGTCVIIAVTAVFKEFEGVYMTANGGPGDSTMTISVMMNKIIQTNQHGYANSLGILLLLLGGIVVLVCNKVFRMDSAE